MTESEFLDLAERTLSDVEDALETVVQDLDLDIEILRQGNVLTLAFENGSQVVINSQAAVMELWVAARSGGFHYRRVEDRWIDTRDGSEFWAVLSRAVSQQANAIVNLPTRA